MGDYIIIKLGDWSLVFMVALLYTPSVSDSYPFFHKDRNFLDKNTEREYLRLYKNNDLVELTYFVATWKGVFATWR